MRIQLLFLLMMISTAQYSYAQPVVWSKDIAPILYNNCVTCHRTGGIAPFELTTYTGAKDNAFGMKLQTHNRAMPPWPPDPQYSRLAHERLLSQDDINKIAKWADDGAPMGDPTLAPPVPNFSNSNIPGTPDLVSRIPDYTSTASSGDVYRCFVIPSGLSADKYISAFEAIPGNRSIVHHVLVFADTTGACATLDANDPGPGYTSFGGVGTNKAIMLGGWVPGTAPMIYPTGFGVKLPKNADIVIQIHYPTGTSGKMDSTKVNFFFSTAPGVRNLMIDPVLNHMLNITPPLFIPANQTKTFTEQQIVPFNATLIGVAPHMHLLAKNISVFGTTPAGDTQKYIRINDWDFHWQGFYLLRKMMKIPAFSRVYANAFYDNTNANLKNPNSPPKDVSAGEATTDEMMLTYFIYTTYQAGDENVVIDPSTPVPVGVKPAYDKFELFAPYPNPAKDEVHVKFFLQEADKVSLCLYDLNGRIVRQWAKEEQVTRGYHVRSYSTKDLMPGIYFVQLGTPGKTLNQKLTIE